MTILTFKRAGAHYIATGHGLALPTEAGRLALTTALDAVKAFASASGPAFPIAFTPFGDDRSSLAIGALEIENTDTGLKIIGSQPIVPGSTMHNTLVSVLEQAIARCSDPNEPKAGDAATISTIASPFA